jgi:hypothetical protein
MLILKGINNLLHQLPACEYARREGYSGEILPDSGEASGDATKRKQVTSAIKRIEQGGITAIYGFSGGGYNAVHIYSLLPEKFKNQIVKVVILGSPGVTQEDFPGVSDVTIYNNPKVSHMDQPDQFLKDSTISRN